MANRTPRRSRPKGCARCAERGKEAFDWDIRMAFQPIVDLASGGIFAHEALVRGPDGQGAGEVLSRVNHDNRYAFDQTCRVVAIESAARLGIPDPISINFMPNAVYNPENCIQTTLWTADKYDFPLERIVFEFTETESVSDLAHLKNIFEEYHGHGFRTAIDDFGSGYSGLLRLADLRPDFVKLDMDLTRDIQNHPRRRKIVSAMVALCADLDITLVAEGIETEDEASCLFDMGICIQQGFLFARPAFDSFVPRDALDFCRAAA